MPECFTGLGTALLARLPQLDARVLMHVDSNKIIVIIIIIVIKASDFRRVFTAQSVQIYILRGSVSTNGFRDTLKRKTDKDTFRSTEQFNRSNALADTCFVSSIVKCITSEHNEEVPKHATQCASA